MDCARRNLFVIFGFVFLHCDVNTSQLPVQLWKKISSVNSTEEFIQRFVRRNNGNFTLGQDEFDTQMESIIFTEEGNVKQSGLDVAHGLVTGKGGCSPRLECVKIPSHRENNTLFWPPCTPLHQCGGCCGHDALKCVPKSVQTKAVLVLRLRLPNPGSEYFLFEGMDTIDLETHSECECQCKVKPQHCNTTIHTYDKNSCSCQCNKIQRHCSPTQTWDNTQCVCVCNNNTQTCAAQQILNNSTCRCEDKTPPSPKSVVKSADPCAHHTCRHGYAPRVVGVTCRCEFSAHQVLRAHSRDVIAAGIPILPHYMPPKTPNKYRLYRL